MSSRHADVFFYGLFMDRRLLNEKGHDPRNAEVAWVDGFALHIGQRAALVPQPSSRVYGVVMSLTLAELERLYSEPSVQAYRPIDLLVHLSSGDVIPALCYNLPDPPGPNERNPEYGARLRDVARSVGLPAEYVSSIQ